MKKLFTVLILFASLSFAGVVEYTYVGSNGFCNLTNRYEVPVVFKDIFSNCQIFEAGGTYKLLLISKNGPTNTVANYGGQTNVSYYYAASSTLMVNGDVLRVHFSTNIVQALAFTNIIRYTVETP